MPRKTQLDALLGAKEPLTQRTPVSRPPSPPPEAPTAATGTIPKESNPIQSQTERTPEQEFVYRCRALGARRRDFDTNHQLLVEMLQSQQYSGNSMRSALEDLENSYEALRDTRMYCESVLTEEDLANRPSYLLPIKHTLMQCRDIVISRFPLMADPFDHRSIAHDDAGSSASSSSNLGHLGKQLTSVVAISYDITKHVKRFDGQQVNCYPRWKTQWQNAKQKLADTGRTPTQLLEEMQKTLAVPALSFVQNLQPVDENLEVAENLLDSLYNDPQFLVKQLVNQLLDLETMKDTFTSLQMGLSRLMGAKQQLSALHVSPEDMAFILFVTIAERKTSPRSKKEWQKILSRKKNQQSPIGADVTYDDFFDAITRAMKICQTHSFNRDSNKQQSRTNATLPSNFTTAGKTYIFCNSSFHEKPLSCPKLPQLQRREILQLAKENKACTLCYDTSHRATSCKLPHCTINNCGK